MKLLVPTPESCNRSLVLDIQSIEGFPVSIHPYNVKENIPEELIDAEFLVTWTNSASNLSDAAKRMKNLKWIQSCAAGPNDVFAAGFDPSIVVCTGSGLHDHTVAEHTLGLLLNAARRFYEMRDFQSQSKWPQHLGGPQPDRPKDNFTTLRDSTVTIWGFGNIAKKLAPWLVSLGATVRGVARKQGVRDGYEVFGEDQLSEVLKTTDALVMILPGDKSTKHALNAERLALLPKHAWVVNVGRGTCIDEEALYNSLSKQEIGGAALDVFDKEPLPSDSKLWEVKNCVISPHAAGGRPQGAETLITENLRRFLAGQNLKNHIKL
ncbi:D-isomer specific 2-hydroxyacid dehydrogenase [Coniella lustricola]|uniref:D-isomer specific 2-hydroxyacid dehydrogenase n=1 Tax=Coniella lustricola TaxID=2025994 RepID=A0A2T3AGL6_9PEZI|nr:D-isomer specific 2-hydroxyacid dehydrogenase [Coniella lustricola]